MKNIILIIIAIVFTIECSAQTKVVNITKTSSSLEANLYCKDIDNSLDPFVGTWIHTDGNTSLKIVLKKELKFYTGENYKDLIVGEYQYIENGVEKINTLSRLDSSYIKRWDHAISGNFILKNDSPPKCEDCLPNQKRVKLTFRDPIQERMGKFILQKIIVDGKPALKAFKTTVGITYLVGTTPKKMIVSDGYYTLIKQ
jgi:hypothetical protein